MDRVSKEGELLPFGRQWKEAEKREKAGRNGGEAGFKGWVGRKETYGRMGTHRGTREHTYFFENYFHSFFVLFCFVFQFAS